MKNEGALITTKVYQIQCVQENCKRKICGGTKFDDLDLAMEMAKREDWFVDLFSNRAFCPHHRGALPAEQRTEMKWKDG